MSKKMSYLLGILLTIIIGTLLYCYLCDTCNCRLILNSVTSNDTNTIVETPDQDLDLDTKADTLGTGNPFIINDANGTLDINSNDNFNFNISNFSVIRPVSFDVDEGIDKVRTYLEEHSSKSIEITGFYKSDEVNNSAYPNLGIARANSTKNYLVTKGLPSNRINTRGALNDDLIPNADSIYEGPLNFTISEVDSGGEDLDALAEKIKANPLILYFDNAETSIDLTAAQRQKIVDISTYIDKADDGKVIVTGHTDNTGRRITNLRVSQGRANFAKAYLVENGILESKIITTAVGPDTPIATNATEEGRAKNRRVEVTIN